MARSASRCTPRGTSWSAQVRVEADGEVWVVSGDYKRQHDPTCAPFEVVPCDTFVTEATFALPVYRWAPGDDIARALWTWWQNNAAHGRASVVFCYALGKAQRLLAELTRFTERSVYVHGAMESLIEAYREAEVEMLPTLSATRTDHPERFVVAGRVLEFVKVHGNQAFVRLSKTTRTDTTPRWRGGRMPLSTELGAAMRELLDEVRGGRVHREAELDAAAPILEAQRERSRIPSAGALLAETLRTREGYHLYLYPFEGRLVHEGLAPLIALRLARLKPATFALSVNDYGFELLCPEPFPFAESLGPELFCMENLLDDAREAMNLAELARRQFRDIARIAGLVFDGYPGSRKTSRQLQTSAGLLYDVFQRYDPANLLLEQARREVMERQFEHHRLVAALDRLSSSSLELIELDRPSPLAFALLVDRVGARLSTESLLERIERMKRGWTTP